MQRDRDRERQGERERGRWRERFIEDGAGKARNLLPGPENYPTIFRQHNV